MKRLLPISLFLTTIGVLLIGLTADTPSFYSRMDGVFEENGTWASDRHDGPSNGSNPGCLIKGETVVHIQDSTVSRCDQMQLGGNASLVVSAGGRLELNGDLELLGTSEIKVEQGGSLFIGGSLLMGGRSEFTLDGQLTIYGDISVEGQAFACGKGSAKAGGRVAGVGWCLDLDVLPIEVIQIDAELQTNENIHLRWTSMVESESDVFVVERSANGMSFKEIGRVDGKAEDSQSPRYEIMDQGLQPGHYYYRIEQRSKSGAVEATELIAATIEQNEETGLCELEVDPNPCVPSCTVTLTDCPGSVFKAYVMDGAGRMVSELVPLNTRDKESTIQYHLNKSNFTLPGVYIIRASSEETEVSKKLIIQ